MSSIVPQRDERDIYLVEDDRGASGPVWCEAPVLGNDFEAVVMDLLEGNYQCPRRVAVYRSRLGARCVGRGGSRIAAALRSPAPRYTGGPACLYRPL